jgi:O-antigen/teichoic acid export membrane protein
MVNTILNILLIPNYGVIGASVATLISYMTMCGIRAYYLKDIIKLNIPWLKHLLVIALIIVQIVVQELKPDAYVIQIVLFGIICMCFAQEINTLIKVLKNKFLKLIKESVNNEK